MSVYMCAEARGQSQELSSIALYLDLVFEIGSLTEPGAGLELG